MDQFIKLCVDGELIELKKYYATTKNINIHAKDEHAFRWSCAYGHLEVAKWLLEISQNENLKLGLINIHENNEEAFRNSCENEQLEVAKWLYLLDKGKFDVKCINENYEYIKDDKNFVRLIGYNYKNNKYLRKEYKKEYTKWRIKISIKMICKILKFYKYVLEKSYSPKGNGYMRTKNDFDLLKKNDTN